MPAWLLPCCRLVLPIYPGVIRKEPSDVLRIRVDLSKTGAGGRLCKKAGRKGQVRKL
jgi:hypothetical protein